MHELSIAMSVIDVAEEEAQRLGAQIVAVHLKLGALSGVVKEALLSAYELACEGSSLAGSRLIVQDIPIVAWCPACHCEREIASAQRICCPTCDTPTPDIRGGNELQVCGLEILDEAPDANRGSATAGAEAE